MTKEDSVENLSTIAKVGNFSADEGFKFIWRNVDGVIVIDKLIKMFLVAKDAFFQALETGSSICVVAP
ncbi:hypothetical protein ACS0TY_034492 [Phlomoides rotata]